MTITRERVAHFAAGRLVGAVTHVLLDDPTRGYGILAETMLDAAE